MIKLHCDKCDKVIDGEPQAKILELDDKGLALKALVYCKECTVNLDLKTISADVKTLIINTDF